MIHEAHRRIGNGNDFLIATGCQPNEAVDGHVMAPHDARWPTSPSAARTD